MWFDVESRPFHLGNKRWSPLQFATEPAERSLLRHRESATPSCCGVIPYEEKIGKTVFLFVQYRDSFRSGCWTGIRINCGSIKQEKAHSPRAREVNHRDKSALTCPEKTLIANNVRSSCTPCTEENNPKFIIDREHRSSSHNPISKRI